MSATKMNGAESLVRTLIDGGIEVCFTNPGTSEMHFCAALDRVPGLRCVLGLFEGVVTGAADGYGRMRDFPSATLLHTGPGLGNGLANLHNARKARSPVVNIVGEHATYHIRHDAPLTSDIEGIAAPVSDWVKTSRNAEDVSRDGAQAIAEARKTPGRIATLILPADTAWNEASSGATVPSVPNPETVNSNALDECVRVLRSGEPVMLLLGNKGLRAGALEWAGRIAKHSGAVLHSESSAARTERGAGRVGLTRIPYVVDQALEVTRPFKHLILAGAKAPVAFFAYPGKPSLLMPEECRIHKLVGPEHDIEDGLRLLAEAVGAKNIEPERQELRRPEPISGALTRDAIGASIGNLLPENAVVCDESITAGRNFHTFTSGCPPHDWLYGTGGAIGRVLPEATGAAVACPDRKVLCLSGDGSAMYTLQSLWTQAREKLDVTTVIFANRSYAILHGELLNVGAVPGLNTRTMFDLENPSLDWVQMANGMGVEAAMADTAETFHRALEKGLNSKGPFLIEAKI